MITPVLLLAALLPAAPSARPARQQRPARRPAPPPATAPALTEESFEAGGGTFAVTFKGGGQRRGAKGEEAKPKFDPESHREIIRQLMTNSYVAQLRKALYWQDSYHQFQSKAHFDNCDFDGGLKYLDQLMRECDAQLVKAADARRRGRADEADEFVRKAFFTLGQALHGVQDFYSHSNFVEMSRGGARKLSEVKPVPVWNAQGREEVRRLKRRGLISGYVFWGFPKRCPKGTPDHDELAKDKPTMKAGRVVVPHWDNITQHAAALRLALRASSEFLAYAFERWPLLREKAGDSIAFDVFQERRSL